jgi:hypothetical protein
MDLAHPPRERGGFCKPLGWDRDTQRRGGGERSAAVLYPNDQVRQGAGVNGHTDDADPRVAEDHLAVGEAHAQIVAEQRTKRLAEGDREAALVVPPARLVRPRRQSLQQVVEAEASAPAAEVAEVVITSVSGENGHGVRDEQIAELPVVVQA